MSAGLPAIIRPAGSHGGHDQEKLSASADLVSYPIYVDAEQFFVTRFADYRDCDGLFRKYRVAFIGNSPFHCRMTTIAVKTSAAAA